MNIYLRLLLELLVVILAIEFICSLYRNYRREKVYQQARKYSFEIKKPLLVIGAPNNGLVNSVFGRKYGCGDICLDLQKCKCEKQVKVLTGDMTEQLKKLKDKSVVIYESGTLEYIKDRKKGMEEINRVAIKYFPVRITPSIITDVLTQQNNPLARITMAGAM